MSYTIAELKNLRESEDKVEFKMAERNFPFAGGEHREQSDRRKCFLGYVVALCNEGGGTLVLGMTDKPPHNVVGTDFAVDQTGALEDEVYIRLQIRVHNEELIDEETGKRVLATYIPPRPPGRTMKFEGVPLMRTGDSLRNMSDEETFAILSEQENDFSAKICSNLTVADLDSRAIAVMKEKYADKQKNTAFAAQSDEQSLTDLDLLINGQLNYAALILLGKKEKIKEILPQCAVHVEYRENAANIPFDNRTVFVNPYFLLIDELWNILNARNKRKPIPMRAYITDIPSLDGEVIREAVNNAVAHRDYTKASEIVIKESPDEFLIQSHGGFPLGVTVENILTINSTPRNRLLADVMTKTGLVERSGQGVDKIFKQNLSDGKDFPSYTDSDLFQVTLRIPLTVRHLSFAVFCRQIQRKLPDDQKLGVHHIIALVKIRDRNGDAVRIDAAIIQKLLNIGAIRQDKDGFLLAETYAEIARAIEGSDREKIINFVRNTGLVRMADIISLFENRLTRRQINNTVFKLVDEGVLNKMGNGSATRYALNLQTGS